MAGVRARRLHYHPGDPAECVELTSARACSSAPEPPRAGDSRHHVLRRHDHDGRLSDYHRMYATP